MGSPRPDGKPFVFCAGADIDEFERDAGAGARGQPRRARAVRPPRRARVSHGGRDQRRACLGGGVELALHCDYRTISTAVRHFACPEVFLGIFRLWGGQLVPRPRPERAVELIVSNPLRQNRMLDGRAAFERGFADCLLEPASSSTSRLRLPSTVAEPLERPSPDLAETAEVVSRARAQVDDQLHGAARAVRRPRVDRGAAAWTIEEGYRREEEAIADLMPGPQAQASIYAFNLVERRAKRGIGIPDEEPRPIRKLGIVGAADGDPDRHARAPTSGIPIVLRDVDEGVVDSALETIRGELAAQVARAATTRARPGSSARSSAAPRTWASTTATSCSRPLSSKWT